MPGDLLIQFFLTGGSEFIKNITEPLKLERDSFTTSSSVAV